MGRGTMVQRIGLLALAACAGAAHAGRHGAEDAGILASGECEMELAYDRLAGNTPQGTVELECRAGPVQLGGEAEHVRERGGSQSAYALEVRWGGEVAPQWQAGVMLRGQWAAHQRPRYDATTLLGLATWTPRPDLDVHVNLGREFTNGGGSRSRWAIAPEWHVRKDLSLLAERYRVDGTHFVRGTLRWDGGHGWGLEAGRAVRLAGPEPSRWTIALIVGWGGD